MRRSLAAGIRIAAVLFLAACSTDQTSQQPLAPSVPSFAASPQCAGGLAADIAKTQKLWYTGDALADLQAKFNAVQAACPGFANNDALQNYLEATITHRPDTVKTIPGGDARAQGIVHLWAQVTLYFTNDSIVRPFTVLTDSGGAEVLSPGEPMTTFDQGGRLALDANSTPGGQHLFTWERRPSADCDGFTSLRVTGTGGASLQGNGTACYQVSDYPHETAYSPKATITMCLQPGFGEVGLIHQKAGFGGEVLDSVFVPFDCSTFHTSTDSWLRQNGGPLGRALASAYDYLAPRPAFASDAGTSGSMGEFSLVGGALQYVFQDFFNDIANPPDIGDTWTISSTSPGYIVVQNGEVVLSQAQGNCANCPVFQLLGTRVNGTPTETIGSYDVIWTSRQTKPNVKEAPFVVLNGSGQEIARLSYVSVSNQNRLIFTVQQAGTDSVYDVGAWLQNVNQTFKITVNTTVLGTNDNTVSFEGAGLTTVSNKSAPFATSLKQIGYVLTGIDAGIMVSDNWSVVRKHDVP